MEFNKCSIFTFWGKKQWSEYFHFPNCLSCSGSRLKGPFLSCSGRKREREGHQPPLCGQLPTKVPCRIISFIFNTVLFVLQQFSSWVKHACWAFWIRKNRNWPQLYFETPLNQQVVQLVLKCNRCRHHNGWSLEILVGSRFFFGFVWYV